MSSLLLACKGCGTSFPSPVLSSCHKCRVSTNNSNDSKDIVKEKRSPSVFKFKFFKVVDKANAVSSLMSSVAENLNETPGIVKKTITKIGYNSSNVSSNIIRKLATNIDGSFDKVSYVNDLLNKIAESANDPRVAIAAKALSKHSPKIAVAITSFALAGVPYGTLISQVAGVAVQQITSSSTNASISSNNSTQSLQYTSSVNQIMEIIVQQIAQRNVKPDSKVCIKCGYKLIANAKFCMSCGTNLLQLN